MTAMTKTLLTLMLASPLTALASVADDIARIRPLLPVGRDIAQIQASLINGSTEADAFKGAKANYLIRDINGDGRPDLLVISEEQPKIQNYKTNQVCASINEPDCSVVYGHRSLHFFLGQRDGSMKLSFTNDKMIIGADEGGAFGDPLEGFAIRKNGSIIYSVYGGSSWRWSDTDVLQFQSGNLYIIGQDHYEGWTGDLRSDTISTDLLTGQVIQTHQKNGDAPVQVKRLRIPLKPLVKVVDFDITLN